MSSRIHKTILLLNQGETENIGDKAINAAISTHLGSMGIDVVNGSFWSEEEVYGKNYSKYPKILRKMLWCLPPLTDWLNEKRANKIIKRQKYDAIVIGGGELLSSHLGFNSSIRTWSKVASDNNIRLYIIGVSGNELGRKKQVRIAEAIKKAKMIMVRDGYTKRLLEKYGITDCKQFPDVVFSYGIIKNKKSTSCKKDSVILSPICFCDQLKKGLQLSSEREYIEYVTDIISKYKNKYLYICNTTPEDQAISKKIYDSLKSKNYSVRYYGYTTIDQYIKLADKSSMIISSRMHAMIIGLICGCGIDPIVFKNKLKVFKDEYQNCNIDKVQMKALRSLNILAEDILDDKK